MSEAIERAVVLNAISSCAETAAQACRAARAAYQNILQQLDTGAQQAMETIDRFIAESCAAPTSCLPPARVREHLWERLEFYQEAYARIPALDQARQIQFAQLAALQSTPLTKFLEEKELKRLENAGLPGIEFKRLIDTSMEALKVDNARKVLRTIREAAGALGFTEPVMEQFESNKGVVSLADSEGHGVVAEVFPADHGTEIKLDLTGYGDDRCHGVMDQLIDQLEKRGLQIEQLRRKSHYRREGVSQDWQAAPVKKGLAAGNPGPQKGSQKKPKNSKKIKNSAIRQQAKT